jgi:hypothetical protein
MMTELQIELILIILGVVVSGACGAALTYSKFKKKE